MFAATNSAGMVMMIAPDVCKTPMPPTGQPTPIPYPNMGQNAMFNPGTLASKITISGGMAATMKSEIPISNGDEAGVTGGVSSSTFIQAVAFTKGSIKVTLQGNGALRMGDLSTHNNKNTVGMVSVPSQVKVMIG